ncbi:MAG: RluA family pseudouridine synthase [Sphingobacteriia bacterium]|jgi:23S rRNA pseudouridine1911/1915/1917 synthase|nr:RluA family pseudouridine synthase [Paludibacteraceae bacterium]NCA79704.1 RluA family pseudouridine synthase [Sphingobacteriia bacterium]
MNEQGKKSQGTSLRVAESTDLMAFLLAKMGGMSRTSIKSLLVHGRVSINGKQETRYNTVLNKGDEVCITTRAVAIKSLVHKALRMIYEDNDVVVVEKREGLLTVATSPNSEEETAYSILKEYVRRENPTGGIFIVHRLDRETSGLLLFAKNRDAQHFLRDNWHQIVRERTYVAVVEGTLKKPSDTIVTWLTENPKSKRVYSSFTDNGGKKSITHYKKIGGNIQFSLLELHLETGRTNQIRVQMAAIGIPVVGDRKYGNGLSHEIDRLALHARVLAFEHPVTGQTLRFETPIPKEFYKLTKN